jgi:hypothetical protein
VHSYLTLAAAKSSSDKHGFLGPRGERYVGSYVDQKLKVKVREAPEHLTPRDVDPLLTHAWAFQERLLPSRVLSYGDIEMKWRCKRHELCECGFKWPEQAKSVLSENVQRERHYHEITKDARLYGPRSPAATNLLEYWRTFIVPQYSMLLLTKDSDRLPALSVIVDDISRAIKDTYLAGVWQSNIIQQLGWVPTTVSGLSGCSTLRTISGKLPRVYRAPSWSWASIDRPVSYPRIFPSAIPRFKSSRCIVRRSLTVQREK